MTLRVSSLIAISAGTLLLSSTAPAGQSASPSAAEDLAKALAGRTAGKPVDCISERSKMHIVDDWTILYRDRSIVYVQKPRGGCHGLWNGMSLIRDQFGTTRMCEGDINQIVDLRTGFGTGACVYSKFVPYRKVS
jgi:hypothetical protein